MESEQDHILDGRRIDIRRAVQDRPFIIVGQPPDRFGQPPDRFGRPLGRFGRPPDGPFGRPPGRFGQPPGRFGRPQPPQTVPVYQPRKIFVGGLHPDASETDVRRYFENFGRVVEAVIPREGFGFITFDSEDAVVRTLHPDCVHTILGKWVEVKRAEFRGRIQVAQQTTIINAIAKTIQVVEAEQCTVRCVTFSPSGSFLAVVFENRVRESDSITIWNLRTDEPTFVTEFNDPDVKSVEFSPDDRTLASSSRNWMKLWDLEKGGLLQTFDSHTDVVSHVQFSPDGATILSASKDKTIKLWETHTGILIDEFVGHGDGVEATCYSPDGNSFASASLDKSVRLWSFETCEAIRTFCGHTGGVTDVCFSPDGRTLVSSSSDHTVRVWDVNSVSAIMTLAGHGDEVSSVRFSPDGRTIASGSFDSKVKLWDAATGDELQVLEAVPLESGV